MTAEWTCQLEDRAEGKCLVIRGWLDLSRRYREEWAFPLDPRRGLILDEYSRIITEKPAEGDEFVKCRPGDRVAFVGDRERLWFELYRDAKGALFLGIYREEWAPPPHLFGERRGQGSALMPSRTFEVPPGFYEAVYAACLEVWGAWKADQTVFRDGGEIAIHIGQSLQDLRITMDGREPPCFKAMLTLDVHGKNTAELTLWGEGRDTYTVSGPLKAITAEPKAKTRADMEREAEQVADALVGVLRRAGA